MSERNVIKVPIYHKHCLTVSEAAEYFGIGEKVLRRFFKEHEDESFLIHNGVKVLVKREAFANYLDQYVTAI